MGRARAPARPVPDWVRGLDEQGLRTYFSDAGHCWLRVRRWAHTRYPTNDVAPLTTAERHELFVRKHMLVLHYHVSPTSEEPNAYLYLCDESSYSLASLSANNRSKVRRGLKRLEVRPVAPSEIAAGGYTSYADTRQRHGVPHMSREAFERHWRTEVESTFRQIWAALAGGTIVAFGSVHRCGRWAAISATVSANSHLPDYSNHALFFTMLRELMGSAHVESVSYGLSSLRDDTERSSLHHFKTSIGLRPLPVARQVIVNPALRVLVNPATRAVIGGLEARMPQASLPRAARAALDFMAEPSPSLPPGEPGRVDEPVGPDGVGAHRPSR